MVIAAIVGAIFFVPDGWGWSTLAAPVPLAMSAAFLDAARTWAGRLAMAVFGLAVTTALVTLFHQSARAVGMAALVVALLLAPLAFVVLRAAGSSPEDGPPDPPQPIRAWTVVGMLVVGAALASTALGVTGFYEHGRAAYAIAYGVPVTVMLADTCVEETTIGKTGVRDQTQCGGTWTINGVQVRGTANVNRSELGGTMVFNTFSTTTVQAYALAGDDEAYTVQVDGAKADGLTAYGKVSAWLALALPVVLVGAFAGRWVRRSRRRA